MGKAKYGPLGPVTGKLANLVFYVAKGEARVRTAGTRYAPLTPAELINTSKMALVMNFFKAIKPFLKLGFGSNLAHSNLNYHNVATSYNKINGITLIADKPELAFNHIRVSSGTGLEAELPIVQLIESELHFTWAHQAETNWEAGSDQVMMMAYFPGENTAIYETAGAKRKTRQDVLLLHPTLLEKQMELYISFISQDRQSVSNSLYLGRLN
jgi:hypothetical protein